MGIGAAESAESTVVARALPETLRDNGFGVLGLVQAIGDTGSTVVVAAVGQHLNNAAFPSNATGNVAMTAGRHNHARVARAAVSASSAAREVAGRGGRIITHRRHLQIDCCS